jgi:hypothetical protein
VRCAGLHRLPGPAHAIDDDGARHALSRRPGELHGAGLPERRKLRNHDALPVCLAAVLTPRPWRWRARVRFILSVAGRTCAASTATASCMWATSRSSSSCSCMPTLLVDGVTPPQYPQSLSTPEACCFPSAPHCSGLAAERPHCSVRWPKEGARPLLASISVPIRHGARLGSPETLAVDAPAPASTPSGMSVRAGTSSRSSHRSSRSSGRRQVTINSSSERRTRPREWL